RRWYLVAWDLGREDWRTFRVDRVTPRPPHGPRFVPRDPPAEDLAAYVSRGVSTRVYASQAAIRLLVSVEEAAERISPSVGTLRAE
ncbi:WYL domain-containing protein, partial [Streptomyces beijiangensis]